MRKWGASAKNQRDSVRFPWGLESLAGFWMCQSRFRSGSCASSFCFGACFWDVWMCNPSFGCTNRGASRNLQQFGGCGCVKQVLEWCITGCRRVVCGRMGVAPTNWFASVLIRWPRNGWGREGLGFRHVGVGPLHGGQGFKPVWASKPARLHRCVWHGGELAPDPPINICKVWSAAESQG